MRLSALLLVLLVALDWQDETLEEYFWDSAWDRLAQLKRAEPGSEQAQELLLELSAAAGQQADKPRGRLLAAQLALIDTGSATEDGAQAAADPIVPPELGLAEGEWPYRGKENWLVAEVLAPGERRMRAVGRAFVEDGADLSRDEILIAWRVGVEEGSALRLENALFVQRKLFEAVHEEWSALDLALTLSRAGRADEADAVLAERIEEERAAGRVPAELWSQRGLIAIGVGDEARARDYLGMALAQGSTNAALQLAKLDLDVGRTRSARSGFRALIWGSDPGAWALRGWGLSLLSEPGSGSERSNNPD